MFWSNSTEHYIIFLALCYISLCKTTFFFILLFLASLNCDRFESDFICSSRVFLKIPGKTSIFTWIVKANNIYISSWAENILLIVKSTDIWEEISVICSRTCVRPFCAKNTKRIWQLGADPSKVYKQPNYLYR